MAAAQAEAPDRQDQDHHTWQAMRHHRKGGCIDARLNRAVIGGRNPFMKDKLQRDQNRCGPVEPDLQARIACRVGHGQNALASEIQLG